MNFMALVFFWLYMTLTVNVDTSLHLLLTAEFLWMTLYTLAAMVGIISDNPNLLTLTFFFLILSAVEFGLGLVLMLLQTVINSSISLLGMEPNVPKFVNSTLSKLTVNNIY